MADTLPLGWGMPPDLIIPPEMMKHSAIANYDATPRRLPGSAAASELCQLAGVWAADKMPRHAYVEPKMNGIRSLFLGGQTAALVSREGSPLACAAHCLPTLLALEQVFGKPMMFDGEFVVPGADAPRPSIAAFRRNRPATHGTLWLFDAVPLDQWQAARTTAPLRYRRATLGVMARMIMRVNVGVLQGVPMDLAASVECLAENFWAVEREGLVIKDDDAPYQRGRSSTWLKLKQGE